MQTLAVLLWALTWTSGWILSLNLGVCCQCQLWVRVHRKISVWEKKINLSFPKGTKPKRQDQMTYLNLLSWDCPSLQRGDRWDLIWQNGETVILAFWGLFLMRYCDGREAKCIRLPTMLIQHKKEAHDYPSMVLNTPPTHTHPPQPMNTKHLGYSSPLYNKAESCLHIAYAILLSTLNSIRLLMMPNTMLLHSTA